MQTTRPLALTVAGIVCGLVLALPCRAALVLTDANVFYSADNGEIVPPDLWDTRAANAI